MPKENTTRKIRGRYATSYARPSDGFQWVARKRRYHASGNVWTFMDASSVGVCLYKAGRQGLSVERRGHIERIVTLYAIDKLRAGHYTQLSANDVVAIQTNLFRGKHKRISLTWASKISARVCRKLAALSRAVRLMRTLFNAKLLVPLGTVRAEFKELFNAISLKQRSGRAPVKRSYPTGPPPRQNEHPPEWVKNYDPNKFQTIE